MNIAFGIFIILHGLVHLLYFGHTARFFELKPGLAWPDGSWAFSRWLGESGSRYLVSLLLILAGFGFISSGVGLFINLAWWKTLLIITSLISAFIYIFFWDGRRKNLDGQGAIGVLIDFWLIVMVKLFHWPK